MVIKAVVERVSSIVPVLEADNVRSPKYQLRQENQQFQQLLENSEKKLKHQAEEVDINANVPDDLTEYIIYDMKAHVSWEIRNRMDIKG